jgi:hypothetical protein
MEKSGGQQKMFFMPSKRNYNKKKNDFVSRFALVQKEYEILNKNNYIKDSFAVIIYYLLIPLAILSSILTLLWVIQFICSYFYILKGSKDRRPGYPFLSYMLIFFQDHDVSFLSFFFFALLTLYLLFCVIKGNFTFGVRFLCWKVHPMEKGKTYMDSLLFNISLILLGSMAITQFVSDCLSDYIAFTDMDDSIPKHGLARPRPGTAWKNCKVGDLRKKFTINFYQGRYLTKITKFWIFCQGRYLAIFPGYSRQSLEISYFI